MDGKKYINELINEKNEAVDFYSPKRKKDRELWVVEEFLKNLGINFSKTELKYNLEEPIDVIFRDANFQIKEIQEKGRKRHKEFKNDLKKLQCTKRLSELFKPTDFPQMTLQEIVNRMKEELQSYIIDPTEVEKTDILFYENLKHGGGISNFVYALPDEWKNWRSVSMVWNGGLCLIFCARENAPDFIKLNVGKIIQNRESPF